MAKRSSFRNVSLIFACGTAMFSDGYANGIIGSVNTLLTRIYGKDALDDNNYNRTLNSLIFVGTIFGMLIFGYLSDKVGRKFGMMVATGIVALFSIFSATSSGMNDNVVGLLGMLSACRFFLGVGVGAEYPCGSVAASEQSEGKGIRGKGQNRWLALATNSMLDVGLVVSALTPLILFWIFGPKHLHAVWRISLGLGAVPALIVFLWRYAMDDPPRYKKDSMKYAPIPYLLILRRYGVRLAAIAIVWFLYDFIVYPFRLYSSTVVNDITRGSNALSVVFGWTVVINLCYLPGTVGGALLLDHVSPKYILIVGLLAQATVGFIVGGLYKQLTNRIGVFAFVYGMFLSLGEMGPGNCTFILASKSCPTAIRGQFFAVAAAVGKVGAFAGTWAFPSIISTFGGSDTARGNTGPFWVGSCCAILSALVTFFFIKPVDQDGMAAEDKLFREYLEANGYDTSTMGLGEKGEELVPRGQKPESTTTENTSSWSRALIEP